MSFTVAKTPVILHLLGNTGAGKTTLMDAFVLANQDRVAGISVGRVLRQRYDASFFAGQAAPAHTATEALAIYQEFVEFAATRYELVIVDGQPRERSQIDAVLAYPCNSACQHDFVLIHADHETRHQRLINRDEGDTAKLDLSRQRLHNDYKNQYEVMIELARRQIPLEIADTEQATRNEIFVDWTERYL